MLEHKRIVDRDLSLDFVVHRVDVRLVHGHALFGERRSVVYGNVVQFGVLRPVFVQNEKQFLGTAKCKDWNEAAATSSNGVVDDSCASGFKNGQT